MCQNRAECIATQPKEVEENWSFSGSISPQAVLKGSEIYGGLQREGSGCDEAAENTVDA